MPLHAYVVQTNWSVEIKATTTAVCKLFGISGRLALIWKQYYKFCDHFNNACLYSPSLFIWQGLPTGSWGWHTSISSGQNWPWGHFSGVWSEPTIYPKGKSSLLQPLGRHVLLVAQYVCELQLLQNWYVPACKRESAWLQNSPLLALPARASCCRKEERSVEARMRMGGGKRRVGV